MNELFIGLGIAFLAFMIWQFRSASSGSALLKTPIALPPGVTLRPQPLLSDAALSLYNLIRLAAEERYLVFAQVPLWAIVDVEAEGKARSQVLRQIALKRLDFVLVHPGLKLVEQVVQLEEKLPAQEGHRDQNRMIQSVVRAAGITYTTLNPKTAYTVAQVTQLLGLGHEESL